jgi:RNA polymerase sigma factor (sigma-70 family)
MSEPRDSSESGSLDRLIESATAGDSRALDAVMRAVRGDVYALALRYLWNPQDAKDACQEILIRVLTGLGGSRGKSAFRTWVYRVACNALLTMSKQRRQHPSLSFDERGEDLVRGLSGSALREEDNAAERLLLEEIKIGCTLAMLQCLDRDHRFAYILGEIMEFDHVEASAVLSTTPAAFRKRLSSLTVSLKS